MSSTPYISNAASKLASDHSTESEKSFGGTVLGNYSALLAKAAEHGIEKSQAAPEAEAEVYRELSGLTVFANHMK